ncbi:hypothetical protein CEXT_746701 [Caerostris extrusa]|uniref:Uncharacterized protein n=1 Tax=Caerostris extrusa TaxID=172846 RepID=A0AAV4YE37_CAEEX|nr:hypothetical protein CEXT_746701 [Caerostris extrusa]
MAGNLKSPKEKGEKKRKNPLLENVEVALPWQRVPSDFSFFRFPPLTKAKRPSISPAFSIEKGQLDVKMSTKLSVFSF